MSTDLSLNECSEVLEVLGSRGPPLGSSVFDQEPAGSGHPVPASSRLEGGEAGPAPSLLGAIDGLGIGLTTDP